MRDRICPERAAPYRPASLMRRSLAAFLCWSFASCAVPLSASGAALAADGKSSRGKSDAGGSTGDTGTSGGHRSQPAAEGSRSRETRSQEDAREAVAKGEILPLSRLLALVDRDLYGMVIAVDLVLYMGSDVYQLKTRDGEGVIRDLRIDARTGRFMKF
ncbi:hypothetical protein NGR_c36220 [Sinorhizobium fredii NGR234]|uniref:PepSY domain-containing protein n=1 Tax=Sinorhizobium fredii (strain NBRC 101917 / NGR234) TaxID=394 RepID=C3MCP5_SINFN|nr:hypothetical protein [Sinorhizobium fredii]ACP27343.1 hypothetical protein NGR_c36220 [Sinorhizobium fredii NGR234]